MILNASQLSALKQRNDEELRRGSRATHGYPARTIADLLQTVEALKKEKKKWQRLAGGRGETLAAMARLLAEADAGERDRRCEREPDGD